LSLHQFCYWFYIDSFVLPNKVTTNSERKIYRLIVFASIEQNQTAENIYRLQNVVAEFSTSERSRYTYCCQYCDTQCGCNLRKS